MKRVYLAGMVVASGLALAPVASASVAGTSLAINFNNQGLTASDVAGITGIETRNWNSTTGANNAVGVGNLVQDSFGIATTTGASVTWSSGGVASTITNGFGTNVSPTPNYYLMSGYLSVGSTTTAQTITISNLPANISGGYDLYIYSLDQTGNRGGSYTVNGNNQVGFTPNTPYPSTWAQDNGDVTPGNYLYFPGLTGSTVTISYLGYTGQFDAHVAAAAIQGIEIVATTAAVPEPSAALGLLLAGAPLVARRRR